MTFTSRVASVMVRASILIDLVFSKTLIRKARLTLGFFLRPSSHVPGRKLRTRTQKPGSSGARGQGLVKIKIVICIYFVIMCIQKMVNAYMIKE